VRHALSIVLMSPAELTRLAEQIKLAHESNFKLRIAFGVACIERVEHLLVDHSIVAALQTGKNFVAGQSNANDVQLAADTAAARSHVALTL
jgi:hypothetical protein